ncbi:MULTISPECIES: zinc-binding dehydrogenase [unclassified Curtobacterium]|uniref:zinc-binding dehydrogenase n=1 Tax=unclassified Curtobacterium TaxID=257496 RepID=UPI000D8B7472|nr:MULTISPECIES: zinc-binding dehydrogenase [unclassified Curtobacterium]PYY34435.1 alcohol dehydrogenase [Curtobacterium sp. MCPF17_046]WIB15525.1 zinc-binding dehydrogenase [Curtobacterium sp. MCPF17_050]
MKAWQFTDTHAPLSKVELPVPEPGAGEVVLAVKAAGICHSDVGLFDDEKWLNLMTVPVTPGHEVAGEIVLVGEAVTEYAVGDRVALWSLGDSLGYRRDGGFGEYVRASVSNLVRIPDNVPHEAAFFAEPGMTAHAAVVTVGKVTSGQKVGIIGFGGLGQIGTRVAALTGARVFVAEINQDVWARATEAGAERVVTDIRELADENLDVIVDFAGFGSTTAGAISAIGQGGRVVQVGMGRLEATINTYDLILKGVTLVGCIGGGKDSMEAVLGWISSGDIQPAIEKTVFDDIPDAIERLKQGRVNGRLVAIY